MKQLRHFFTSSLFILLVLSAAPGQGAAPAAHTAPAPSPKVVMLSLDGASAAELHQLHEEGALTAGGFDRFFREGQVADRLVPVNPTITAVNHISLATGYPPSLTGIVGNRFHPAGTPFLDSVSGFAAPIATETLWEAALRQGKRAGVLLWPGADATLERRTANWGMLWLDKPDRASTLVTLHRSNWSRMPDGPLTLGLESRSPILHSLAIIGPEGQAGREFDLLAVDRTDDGKVNYDAIVPGIVGDRVFLRPGEWGRVPCQQPDPHRSIRSTFCWLKVMSFDPGLDNAQVYFNAVYNLRAYPPMTFEVNLATSGLLWTGPPDDHSLTESWQGRPGIDLETWLEQADRFAGFLGSVWRNGSGRADWDLMMGYTPLIDDAGHRLTLTDPAQPGFTPERRDAFAAARRKVWQMVDRELARFLKSLDLKRTTVVVVSDHGMAPVHTRVDLNVILRDKGLLATGADGKILAAGTRAYAIPAGGSAQIYVDPAAPGRDKLIADLKSELPGWSEDGQKPIARVLTRHEASELDLDNPNSGDLIVIAKDGYALSGGGLESGKALGPPASYGVHGYPNTDPRMAGIYMALGRGITPGNAGTVRNTDVAGRVAQWLGIEKPRPKP
jgi:predicted AlkP superfamily pyrophosphatase or phosphodiesterase